MVLNKNRLLLKLSSSFILLIVSFWYIYHFYYENFKNSLDNINLNLYFLSISFLCLSMPHIARTFACISLLKLKHSEYYKMFSILSIQYFLIFLFPFKLGELSIVELFKNNFNMSRKRAFCLMLFIQFMETASCSVFLALGLYCAQYELMNFHTSDILRKAVISGIFVF